MTTQQLIRLVIIAIFIGGPIVGKILDHLKKQAAEQRRRRLEQAKRDEILRTGREPEASVSALARAQLGNVGVSIPTAPRTATEARQRDLAERRQQQLEELRRRRAARTTEGAPTTRPQTQSRPPVQPKARPQAPVPQRASMPAPRPGQVQRREFESQRTPRPQQGPTARPRPEGPRTTGGKAAPRPAAQEPPHARGQMQADTTEPVSLPDPIADLPRSVAEWRRVIVAREVLGPPVSLRPDWI